MQVRPPKKSNADRLQSAVAMMRLQAEEDNELRKAYITEKAREKEYKKNQQLRGASEVVDQSAPLLVTIPPMEAYGYDAPPAGSGFKNLIDDLKKNLTTKPARQNEEKREEEELKELSADQKEWLTNLEKIVKEAQNGWMKGQPVDPEDLKSKVGKLEVPTFDDPEKDKKAKEFMKGFSAKIDKEVDRLQVRVQARADSQETALMNTKILMNEIQQKKLKAVHEQKGSCEVFKMRRDVFADFISKDGTEDLKLLEGLHKDRHLQRGSHRAYILVEEEIGEENEQKQKNAVKKITSAYYMDSVTREFVKLEMDKDKEKNLTELAKDFHLRPFARQETPNHTTFGRLLSNSEDQKIRDLAGHHPAAAKDITGEGLSLSQWYSSKGNIRMRQWSPLYSAANLRKGIWRTLADGELKDVKGADWKETLPYIVDNKTNELEVRKKAEEKYKLEEREKAVTEYKKIIKADKNAFSVERKEMEGERQLLSLPPLSDDEFAEAKARYDDEVLHIHDELAATRARDEAMQRLQDKQQGEGTLSYGYGKNEEKFTVSCQKDKNGDPVFSIQYHPRSMLDVVRSMKWGEDHAKGMAALVDLCYKSNPFYLVQLGCSKLEFPRDISSAKGVLERIKYAIEAAEQAREKGIYIGLSLSEDAKNALRALGELDAVEKRTNSLQNDWRKHVKEPHEERKKRADAKYGAETELGKLLAGPVRGEVDVAKAFKTQDSNKPGENKEQNTGERLQELKTEIQKLEGRVKEAGEITSQFIAQKINELQEEFDKEVKEFNEIEKKNDPLEMKDGQSRLERLDKMITRLDGLQSSQASATQEIGQIAKEALNYEGWVANKTMLGLVGWSAEHKHNDNDGGFSPVKNDLIAPQDKVLEVRAYAKTAQNSDVSRNNVTKINDLKKSVRDHKQKVNAMKEAAEAKAAQEQEAVDRPAPPRPS